MRRNDLAHEVKPKAGEAEDAAGLNHVPGRIGNVVRGERQQRIKRLRKEADAEAQKRGDAHAEVHVPGNGLQFDLALGLGPEGEVRELDADGKERAHGGELHAERQPRAVGLGRAGDGHGLGHEAVEKRHARDGDRADHVADHDQRQARGQSAELGQLSRARCVKQAARAHEQQALIQDVGIGVGAGPVEGHGRADADAAHHVPDLGDDVVGQDASGVVLYGRVKDAVETHDAAADGEDLEAGVAARQDVDGGLGGKRAHEDRAGDRGFGVGVGQPGVQGHEGGVDQEADQDDVVEVTGGVRGHGSKVEGADGGVAQEQAGQQEQAAEDVEQEVAEARGRGLRRAAQPDQEHRTDAHELPEDKERHIVPGEDAAEAAGHVQTGGHVLAAVGHVQGVDEADQRLDGEDVGENQCQGVHPAEQQRVAEVGNGGELARAVGAERQGHHRGDGQDRRGEQQPAPGFIGLVGQEGHDQGQGQEADGRMPEMDARYLFKTGHCRPPGGQAWGRRFF
ncbi:hypothetical protein DSECCO2_621420 [anaerobic digester metagenome]